MGIIHILPHVSSEVNFYLKNTVSKCPKLDVWLGQEGEGEHPEEVRQEAGAQRQGLLPRHRACYHHLLPPRHHSGHGHQLAR